MTIQSCITTSYKTEIVTGGIHEITDTYMIALYASTANLDKSTTIYTTDGECTGTNYVAGGEIIANGVVSEDNDVVILSFDNPKWVNLTILDMQGCMIYNASKGNRAVAIFNFGTKQVLSTTDLTLLVPGATATTGLIRFN